MSTFLLRENELAVQEESAYGTSPGSLAGGDFFRQTSSHVGIVGVVNDQARDRDRGQYQDASVYDHELGRSMSNVSIETELVPAGVAGTPTAPDIDTLLKAVFGASATRTAHTTLTSGSTTTVLNFATGGVAASGSAVGDLIAVDVSAVYGLEVRQITGITTDAVTVDRALSAAPVSGRSVYVGTTYRMTESALISLYLWLFGSGTGYRYAVPGVILPEMDFSLNFGEAVPIGKFRFSGMGKFEITHSASRPTPTFAGVPLAPALGSIWLGTTKNCLTSLNLNVKNGLELRNNESCDLQPTGVKRTGNNSRFHIEHTAEFYLTTDRLTDYNNAMSRTARDTIVQIGNQPGRIFAYRLPAWKPRPERTELEGEVGLRLTGRAYASVTKNTEITAAFL